MHNIWCYSDKFVSPLPHTIGGERKKLLLHYVLTGNDTLDVGDQAGQSPMHLI